MATHVMVPWDTLPPYGCYRNEMVLIQGGAAAGEVATTVICQPLPSIIASHTAPRDQRYGAIDAGLRRRP